MRKETLRLPADKAAKAKQHLKVKHKFKPWSHQDHLKSLVGKVIVAQFIDASEPKIMLLLDADQWTILANDAWDGSTRATIYFKSHIKSIYAYE